MGLRGIQGCEYNWDSNAGEHKPSARWCGATKAAVVKLQALLLNLAKAVFVPADLHVLV